VFFVVSSCAQFHVELRAGRRPGGRPEFGIGDEAGMVQLKELFWELMPTEDAVFAVPVER